MALLGQNVMTTLSHFETTLAAIRHYVKNRGLFNIGAAFSADEARFTRFSIHCEDLLFDFSKTALDARMLVLLESLGKVADIEGKREAMFSGAPINETEQRAALHIALRAPDHQEIHLAGTNIVGDVHSSLAAMTAFSNGIRKGDICGATGEAFTDIVNIGIGGSDLGPRMATRALKPYHDGPRCHFVGNLDAADIVDHLAELRPQTTLFIVVSKTFTTRETMSNAAIARQWIVQSLGEAAVAKHFVAASTAVDKVLDFGIERRRLFSFWNWVGGRMSVWSAVGLSLMLAIGSRQFLAFLAGARAMDEHFSNTAILKNIPIMLGLIGFFHRVICSYPARAIIPYAQRLRHLPAYLQQLDMESNGKQAHLDGHMAKMATAPVVFGEVGSNAQHAFFQMLHQGSDTIPVEFILFAQGYEQNLQATQQQLLANGLAQAQALMLGQTQKQAEQALIDQGFSSHLAKKLAPHRTFPGNRPSMMLVQDKLTPFSLGRLLALYEHRTFVEGILFNINSFDQWGVELGKSLANEIEPLLTEKTATDEKGKTALDGSTRALIAHLRARAL